MNPDIIELTGASPAMAWGLPAVFYFAMIQVGAACLLLACAADAWGLKALGRFKPLGLLTGLSLILIAPLNLVGELLQPARAASLMWRIHATSPLTWGVFILTGTCLFGLEYFRRVLGTHGASGHAWPARLASAGALGLLSYTSLELYLAKAVIPWQAPWPPLVLAASALAGATGLLALLLALTGQPDKPTTRTLYLWLLGPLLAQTFLGAAWLWISRTPGTQGLALGLWTLAATAALPALMLGLNRGQRAVLLPASALALAGVLTERFAVIIGGQEISPVLPGLVSLEAHITGHAGILQAVAPLALWLVCLSWALSTAWGRKLGETLPGQSI